MDLPGKYRAVRDAQRSRLSAAVVQQGAAAGQQELHVFRQAGQGLQQGMLALAAGEFRRVQQGHIALRQAQPVPHGAPCVRRGAEAGEVYTHAGDLLHTGRGTVGHGPAGIPGVHGQEQVRLGRGHGLRPGQEAPLQPRGLVVEEVAVDHVDELRAVLQAPKGPAGEERRQ